MNCFQAKMVIILPHMIAVHCTRSGRELWRNGMNLVGDTRVYQPFMTRNITGYLIYGESETPQMRLYHTATGQFFASHVLMEKEDGLNFTCRGPYVCYTARETSTTLHVISAKNGKVQESGVEVPLEHFQNVTGIRLVNLSSHEHLFIKLMGYVGKSNVLVGSFRASCFSYVLFSLDLDAAVDARSEEEIRKAFSLVLASPDSVNTGGFKPVFRTDLANGCLDLVGVAWKEKSENVGKGKAMVVKTYYFVTEMQLLEEK